MNKWACEFPINISSSTYFQDAHDGEVLSAKFSISGRLFVTGGGDKKVKVWETVNGTEKFSL